MPTRTVLSVTVEVRLFASLRDAAGTSRLEVGATDLGSLLTELRERFGEPFSSRLAVSTVVLDGEPTEHGADVPLDEVREVALLPPFSGG